MVLITFYFSLIDLFLPYLEREVFLSKTPNKSNLPLIHLYFTPGRSLVRPPRTITIEWLCNECPSPGIYAVIVFLVDNLTLATFLKAELGFFGAFTSTLITIPFAIGLPLRAGVFDFLTGFFLGRLITWFKVAIVVKKDFNLF